MLTLDFFHFLFFVQPLFFHKLQPYGGFPAFYQLFCLMLEGVELFFPGGQSFHGCCTVGERFPGTGIRLLRLMVFTVRTELSVLRHLHTLGSSTQGGGGTIALQPRGFFRHFRLPAGQLRKTLLIRIQCGELAVQRLRLLRMQLRAPGGKGIRLLPELLRLLCVHADLGGDPLFRGERFLLRDPGKLC